MHDHADIFRQILDDPTFQAVVMDHYLQRSSSGRGCLRVSEG
jgi:hypothetical protein